MDFNCIFDLSEDNAKMAALVGVNAGGQSMKIKFWVDNDTAYTEYFGQQAKALKAMFGTNKIKEAFSSSDANELMVSLDGLDLASIIERAQQMDFTNQDIVVKVSLEEQIQRFEITNVTAEGVKIYLVFEDNALVSAQLEMAEGIIYGLGETKIVISAFDSAIEMPDFEAFYALPY